MEMYKAFRVWGLGLRSVAPLPEGWMTYYTPNELRFAKGGSCFYCFNTLEAAVKFVEGGWLGDIEGVEVWRVEAEDVHKATDPILCVTEVVADQVWKRKEELFELYWGTGASELPWRFKIPPPDGAWLAKTIRPIERIR